MAKDRKDFHEVFHSAVAGTLRQHLLGGDGAAPQLTDREGVKRLDPARAEEWLAFDAAWHGRKHRIESDRQFYGVTPDGDEPEIER